MGNGRNIKPGYSFRHYLKSKGFIRMKQAVENSNSLKMVFRNRPENEKIVRTTAAVFASVLDPTLEEISDFKTAVSEAVTNAIIHA